MKTLTTTELVTVAGGTVTARSTTDALTTQLTSLQSSIKDVASANNNNNNSSNPMMMMAMMMAMRPQAPQVVAAGAPVAAGPVVNISTRVRRW